LAQTWRMADFRSLNLNKQLQNAIDDLGFTAPTPIQEESFKLIRSGRDMVGIAQTGTGKTLGYLLPLLQDHTYSKQNNPRILVLVPTRELVMQVEETITSLTTYMNLRVAGVYGGVNIKTQKAVVEEGCDILVATPGRLYDLVLSRAVQLKDLKKLVIDEVDVMLDLGFRPQLTNLFELMPGKRQSIMFSATMTEEVDALLNDFFIKPERVSIAVSGTPLENIEQACYAVPNFHTKANLLKHLVADKETFKKVLVFVQSKRYADRLYALMEEELGSQTSVIHSNKTQNYRVRSIEDFDSGKHRILISTDIMARGLDLNKVSHVINFDTPLYPENYMHRIGRTGRAKEKGASILFYTPAEEEAKLAIEVLMEMEIPQLIFPEEVTISDQLIPDERPKEVELVNHNRNRQSTSSGPGFHEKKDKNKKTNQGGSYHRELAKKYKKPKTRGDKNANRRRKK
jgi:ATP-dependent RNA helicase RhlE